ncbi:uncharacterized mitochondrial protein AtMg00820-like [Dioscorea cayenensis subsp. rotundata]|uniref:Uncharacterized mitochondrial protein AtMg00820-like n=1 Tax=Dioscorea cayennensis subsp. rotundata TaxID=55577 RepID=A0AB40BZW7_DIOCR|nr:uncharacterized mitochondrial protein AtMg00820-like [Dioscorea cayenensis subsp. rotundata]
MEGGRSDQAVHSGGGSPGGKVRSLKDIYERCTFSLNVTDPSTYEKAVKTEVWREAMREELDAIERNNTWEPEWSFHPRSIQRHKARLVARGYTQQAGIDFHEVYAPVVGMETVRLLLAIVREEKVAMIPL